MVLSWIRGSPLWLNLRADHGCLPSQAQKAFPKQMPLSAWPPSGKRSELCSQMEKAEAN